MDLAQTVSTNLTNQTVTTPPVPAMTIGLPTLLIGLLILAIVLLAIWAVARSNNRNVYRNGGNVVGSKGGHVRKRVIEYEDVPENEAV